jgi:hypothetical protein
LLLTFRSIVIPLKAIVLNLLSVGAAYGVLVLVFQDGRFESLLGLCSIGGVTAWLPLFLFVVLFGLSIDYHEDAEPGTVTGNGFADTFGDQFFRVARRNSDRSVDLERELEHVGHRRRVHPPWGEHPLCSRCRPPSAHRESPLRATGGVSAPSEPALTGYDRLPPDTALPAVTDRLARRPQQSRASCAA